MRTATLLAGLLGALTSTAAAQVSSDTLPIAVAKRQIDAFNRRDLDAFMAVWADSAVVAEFPSGKIMWQGKTTIRERFAGVMKAPGVPTVEVEPRIVNGAFVADNERWPAPPGARNSAVWMYEIRGGLIQRAWTVRLP